MFQQLQRGRKDPGISWGPEFVFRLTSLRDCGEKLQTIQTTGEPITWRYTSSSLLFRRSFFGVELISAVAAGLKDFADADLPLLGHSFLGQRLFADDSTTGRKPVRDRSATTLRITIRNSLRAALSTSPGEADLLCIATVDGLRLFFDRRDRTADARQLTRAAIRTAAELIFCCEQRQSNQQTGNKQHFQAEKSRLDQLSFHRESFSTPMDFICED